MNTTASVKGFIYLLIHMIFNMSLGSRKNGISISEMRSLKVLKIWFAQEHRARKRLGQDVMEDLRFLIQIFAHFYKADFLI